MSVAPEAVAAFLPDRTPGAWLDRANRQLPQLLNDHANCEMKAASTALGFIYRYPERDDLCQRMSRIAREELRHFEQVRKIMRRLEVPFEVVSASRYAAGLRESMRRQEPQRLMDALLVGALIEARSCERFAALVPRLAEPLRSFYAGLLASEARHFQSYIDLARQECRDDSPRIDRRLAELKAIERDLILSPDAEFRFHSGLPAPIADEGPAVVIS